jgi:hypothetical protein
MPRNVLFLIGLVAASVGPTALSTARADDKWGFDAAVDLGFKWIQTPPSLSQVNGTTVFPVAPASGPAYLLTLHGDVAARYGPLLVPLTGLELGVGGGSYGGGDGPQAYHTDGPLSLVSLGLPGIGLGTTDSNFRFKVSVNPAIDYLSIPGHFVVQGVNVDTTGDGLAFSLRSRAELCFRGDESAPWLCLVGGPTLLQGNQWLDGGYVGLGSMFD